MAVDYIKNKVDWVVYLERRNPLFYICIFNKAFGDRLKEVVGFGFKYQLYTYEKENGFYINRNYKSGRELAVAKKFFSDLIKNDQAGLADLCIKCKYYLHQERKLVKQFSQDVADEYIIENYNQIIELLINIFTHLTTIPMLILNTIDTASLADLNTKEFKNAFKLFSSFRKASRNIHQETVLKQIWQTAAKLTGVKDYLDFSFFSLQELGNLFQHKKYPSISEVKQRKTGCVFYEDRELGQVCFNYQPNFLKKIGIERKKVIEVKLIKGRIANKGYAKGKVCMLNVAKDIKKCRVGDIVVTVNSSPIFMPALIRCGGIIADEGGTVCHAAIISRELNKPCIIGTKIATKIFKDGDTVEVDADNGVARKL